jgi:hypothetical protein
MGSNEVQQTTLLLWAPQYLNLTMLKVFTITVLTTLLLLHPGHIHEKELPEQMEAIVFPFTALASPISYTSTALAHLETRARPYG